MTEAPYDGVTDPERCGEACADGLADGLADRPGVGKPDGPDDVPTLGSGPGRLGEGTAGRRWTAPGP
ncbi:hypothetical protein MRQ86_33415 [Streptomyces sp. MMS21 TC-5]|uniref:hypothetical protein n=1 Tax=Streptomyces sp. MMS21 TC-5 TaxID=2925833 RepID=UPI001F622FD0|nr:hypothetical protein [Streptomyces sp. MMS21 TC-5]MCI4085123.1 hypothetical protein [Streptomyces sp. MMS21 TC-5]